MFIIDGVYTRAVFGQIAGQIHIEVKIVVMIFLARDEASRL
jgi:hypothetical protein